MMKSNPQLNNEIVNLQKTLLKAMLEKNASFINENLHDGFIFTSPRAVILNKEGFIKNFAVSADPKFEVFQLSDERVVITNNIAILHCLVQVKVIGQTGFEERVTFSLIKAADKWLTLTMNATFVPEQK